MNNKRPNRFQPRFTDREHDLLCKLAAQRGVSPTRLIEDAVRSKLKGGIIEVVINDTDMMLESNSMRHALDKLYIG